MKVSNIDLTTCGESLELRAQVSSATLKEPFLLWYRFPAEMSCFISANSGNPFLTALLLPAMKAGEPLEIPAPISPRLAHSIKRIQTIFQAWDRTLSKVEVHAPLRKDTPPAGEEVGLFFSLGVDAFYSLIKNALDHPLNEDVITHLIIVYGADIYISDEKHNVFAQMLANTYRIGKQLGKDVVPITTNVKEFLSACRIRRGFIGHGTALISVSLALEGMFRRINIATGNTYTDLAPAGNHPLLDPLWSSETCEFVHDGLEANRLDKIRMLTQSQIALDTLRVCWAKERPEYNCGQCAKCLRTMLGLHIAGALEQCRTLPNTIDPELLRTIPLLAAYEEGAFFQELLDALDDSESDTLIRAALLEGLTKGRRYFERLEQAKRTIDRLIPLHEEFILVDQDTIRHELGIGRKVIPFLERDGQYHGPPADDEEGIHELERLRASGAKFIVFWWSNFWWLDYYAGLNQHLRSRYHCILEDDSLIAFDLTRPADESGEIDEVTELVRKRNTSPSPSGSSLGIWQRAVGNPRSGFYHASF